MRRSLCCRVFLGLLIGTAMGLLGLYMGRYSLLYRYGVWLTAETSQTPTWQALFVLSGRPFERGMEAAFRWQTHPTPIYLTGGLYNDNLLAAGTTAFTECEMGRRVLVEHCVPDSVIHLLCEGTSTYEEILLIERVCQARGYRHIAILSSAFHGRRIHLLAQRHLAPAGIQVSFLPARPLLFQAETWWQSEYGFLTAFEETLKLIYYWWRGLY